jgi:hypothetical protein
MKKSLLLLPGIFLVFHFFAQQQIGNSALESWDNVGASTEEPTNWNSFKSASGSLAGFAGQQISRSTAIRAGATGSYCARIWSNSVLGVVANGNMTLGKINMGSSTVTSASNYNFTNTADPNFSEAFTATPDSLVFWVKYTNANSASQARVSAVLHDTYDYQDGFNVHAGSAPHKVAEISHNYSATGGQWVRKSIPWNYTGPAAVNTYALITFTTNKTPGGGNTNDEVLIDDIQLIYNPVNQQIVANWDAATTFEDAPISIPVTANDTDFENDINLASLMVSSSPANGSATVALTGEILYTPNPGYFGNDTFIYQICDGGNPETCDTAIVYVSITEIVSGNNPIVANDDVAETDMFISVTTNVLANDVDFENQIDNSTLTVTVQPTNGTTSVNTATGEITYTPILSFYGLDSYSYSICDAGAPAITCDEATVSVTVNLTWGTDDISENTFQCLVLPNEIKIIGATLNGNYTLYSANGALVEGGEIKPSIVFQNLSGVYFLHLQTEKGIFCKKVVIL